jgi:hypothetical protein
MPSNLDKFDHLVVLMLENRSFDNMLGWLYDPNNAPPFDKVPGGQTFNGVSGKGLINPPYTHPPQTEGPGDGTAPVIHLPDPARLGDNGLDSDAIVRVSQRLGTVLLMVGNNTVRSAVAALRLKGIADWLCQIGAQPRDVLEGYDEWLNTAAPDDFDRKNTLRIRTIGLIVELMGHLAIAYQEAEVR